MIDLNKIKEVVENTYKTTIERTRIKDSTLVVDARKTYSLLSKKLTKCSLREIGEPIDRDHCIIIYYCKKAEHHLICDPIFRRVYNECKSQLE